MRSLEKSEHEEDNDDLLASEKDVMQGEGKYVKDWKSFEQYKKLKNNPIFIKRSKYICSDGTLIMMGMLPHQLPKKIEHLPPDEQKEVIRQHNSYRQLMNKISSLKNLAFGLVPSKQRPGEFAYRILDPKKEEIIELFSKMFTPTEVHEIIVKEWKIGISLDTVMRFRTKWINVISEKLEKYKREYSDVRLGVKRSRLDELTFLYNTTKDRYRKSPNRGDHEVLLKTLEQVRKEVEGDKLMIEGNLDVNIESTVNIHLQREVFKSVNINTIIVARIGARLGIHTQEVISRLLNSHYSKFSGIFSQPKSDMEQSDYPSTIPYDFDKINAFAIQSDINRNIEREKEKEKEVEITEEVKRLGLKEALLEKLRGRNQEVKDKVVTAAKAESRLMEEAIKASINKKKKKKS